MIEAREAEFPLPVVLHFARCFYLEEIDERWIEHLKAMEALREGIGLRGYGQKDPKQEYKKEGFVIFGEMMDNIGRNVCEKLFHMQLQRADAPAPRPPVRAPPQPPPCRPRPRRSAQDDRVGRRRRGAGRRRQRRRQRRGRGASRCAATSPRSAATIPVPAAAARNTRNATAPSSRR